MLLQPGQLTILRAHHVRNRNLAHASVAAGLHKWLRARRAALPWIADGLAAGAAPAPGSAAAARVAAALARAARSACVGWDDATWLEVWARVKGKLPGHAEERQALLHKHKVLAGGCVGTCRQCGCRLSTAGSASLPMGCRCRWRLVTLLVHQLQQQDGGCCCGLPHMVSMKVSKLIFRVPMCLTDIVESVTAAVFVDSCGDWDATWAAISSIVDMKDLAQQLVSNSKVSAYAEDAALMKDER